MLSRYKKRTFAGSELPQVLKQEKKLRKNQVKKFFVKNNLLQEMRSTTEKYILEKLF